jgi:hypothetical protein
VPRGWRAYALFPVGLRAGVPGALRDASTAVPRTLCAHAEKARALAASLDARSAESWAMPALARGRPAVIRKMIWLKIHPFPGRPPQAATPCAKIRYAKHCSGQRPM